MICRISLPKTLAKTLIYKSANVYFALVTYRQMIWSMPQLGTVYVRWYRCFWRDVRPLISSYSHRAHGLVVPDAAPANKYWSCAAFKNTGISFFGRRTLKQDLSSTKTRTRWRKASPSTRALPIVWNHAWTGFRTSSKGGLRQVILLDCSFQLQITWDRPKRSWQGSCWRSRRRGRAGCCSWTQAGWRSLWLVCLRSNELWSWVRNER